MKKIILLILSMLLLLPHSAKAQKEFRQIKDYLKSGKKMDEAAKLVVKLENDTNSLNSEKRAELMYLGFAVQDKIYQAENEKNYLKQKYDTATLFTSVYSMFSYAERCYDSESIPNKKGKVKLHYSPKNTVKLSYVYPYLLNAGLYYYNKASFAEAIKYLSMYIEVNDSPLIQSGQVKLSHTHIPLAAYIIMMSNEALRNYPEVIRYEDIAMGYSEARDRVLGSAANAYLLTGDTAKYEFTLGKGLNEFPHHPFFFTKLVDLYMGQKDYAHVVAFADSMSTLYPDADLFKFGKTNALLQLGRNEECISICDQLIRSDSVIKEAYLNAGLAYVNLAELAMRSSTVGTQAKISKSQKSKATEYYHKAKTYVEEYRSLTPDYPNRWALLLYKIYLNLNMEKEFKEMESLISLHIS